MDEDSLFEGLSDQPTDRLKGCHAAAREEKTANEDLKVDSNRGFLTLSSVFVDLIHACVRPFCFIIPNALMSPVVSYS